MIKKFLILILFTTTFGFAQYGYRDGNRIGISADFLKPLYLPIIFKDKPEIGFAGGLSVSGNY
jgi:hypothetical protein